MKTDQQKIHLALRQQLENYPESTLADVYKNFFQDAFGPGHLMSDTAAAVRYIKKELEQTPGFSQKSPIEFTGYKHQFVRVDLFLVKNGTLPLDVFVKAFTESASDFQIPDIESWKKEWNLILGEMEAKEIYPMHYNEDKIMLDSLLNSGKFVVHHSHRYIEAYQPHYRIVSAKNYEKYLKKCLGGGESRSFI